MLIYNTVQPTELCRKEEEESFVDGEIPKLADPKIPATFHYPSPSIGDCSNRCKKLWRQ